MHDKRDDVERLDVIEGADAGSLGIDDPPASAPPGARVDGAESHLPGATFDEPIREAKPWASSLAAESSQAGVGNMPLDEVEPQYPESDDEAF
jgi:hypothetical protein